jgi:MFS family permease
MLTMQKSRRRSLAEDTSAVIGGGGMIPMIDDLSADQLPHTEDGHYASSTKIVFFSLLIETMGLASIQPLLPGFVLSRNEAIMWIGAIMTAQSAASIVGAPLMGSLADIFGPKRAILFCILVDAAVFFASGFVDSVLLLCVLRAIAGGVLITPPCHAYISDNVPSEERRTVLTKSMVGTPLGYLSGYCVGGFVSSAFGGGKQGFLAVCITDSVLALMCAYFIFWYARSSSRNDQVRVEQERKMSENTKARNARLRADSESNGSFRRLLQDWKFFCCATLSLCGAYVKELIMVRYSVCPLRL